MYTKAYLVLRIIMTVHIVFGSGQVYAIPYIIIAALARSSISHVSISERNRKYSLRVPSMEPPFKSAPLRDLVVCITVGPREL